MTDKKPDGAKDLNALAREACDLWQDHLASYAADAKGKAELMKLMEPTRQLFAEWSALMQHGTYADLFGKQQAAGGAGGRETGADGGGKTRAGTDTARPETPWSPSDGGAFTVAQLADRVAELEAKLARLEAGAKDASHTSAHTARPRPKS